MDINILRKKTTPINPVNIIIFFASIGIFYWCWMSTEMSLPRLVGGWQDMVRYIVGEPDLEDSGFFPPTFHTHSIKIYLLAMLETVQMAVIALVISIFISVPFAFLASRNILEILFPGDNAWSRSLRFGFRYVAVLFANICRSINEMVWALIFVSAVGLGPMAGIIALGIHTGGVLVKLLSEGIEAIDSGPVDALRATGAGFLKVIRYGVVPQILPHFVSMILYRFESDVRSASVLGFVGAGGIGFYLFDKIRGFETRDVTTILIILVLTVWIIDEISAYLRKKAI